MAACDFTITRKDERRPCWVDGRRAMFHRWTDSARPVKPRGMEDDETAERFQVHNVHGLVEYEDGTVARVWPNTIQFADGGEFKTLAWEQMEAQRDGLPYKRDEGEPDYPERQNCSTCAHLEDNVEICPRDNCAECTIPCHCKECRDFDKWEQGVIAAW